MNDLRSIFKANDPYERLISQIVQYESRPKYELVAKKSEQESLKKVLDSLDSKLSALNTAAGKFTDVLTDPFGARKAILDSDEFFSISATDDAPLGSHSVQVERLARTDMRISKQFTASDTSLRSFFDTNGAQTFEIQVASPTDTDPDNRVSISVTVDPTGSTDEEILQEIADAINTAMDDASDNGLIKSKEEGSASVVFETSGTLRLSIRSGQTGFTNRLSFTDSANGLLSLLEVNANTVASGSNGGQIVAVGTDATNSELNSKAIVDGITIYRDTNVINDAIAGVTLTLKQPSTTAVNFTVESDLDSIKDEINDFISKYNELMDYLNSRTQIDADAEIRGTLAGDSTFTGLRIQIRNDLALQVSGQPADGPQFLEDIGITIERDGTLKLSDESKLEQALEENSDAVRSLFSGTDGIATRLQNRLDTFLGSQGIISKRIDSVEDRIGRLEDRIDDWDDKMARREEQLRKQFAQLQETLALFNGQQQALNSFFLAPPPVY